MKRNTLKRISSALLFIVLLFSTNIIFAQDGIITNIHDLESLDSAPDMARSASIDNSDRIIILYNQASENQIAQLQLNRNDFTAGATLDNRIDVLKTSGNTPTDTLIESIRQNEAVSAVDYDEIVTALDINDFYYNNSQIKYFKQINADKTVNLNQSNLVKVAVLDSGLNTEHEDMQNRYLLEGYNYLDHTTNIYDDNGHGSAISSIISALTNNSIGMAGFTGTSNVKVVPYKVLDKRGEGYISNIVSALKSINQSDIRVINLSLGIDMNNEALEEICNEASASGKIILAASGNDNQSELKYPARYNSTIAVGAVNSQNIRCTNNDWGGYSGSNFGTGLDVVAPGNDLVCIRNMQNDGYRKMSGTSMATPVVASLVALMIEDNPTLNIDQIRQILSESSTDLGNPGYDIEYGYGLVDFTKALTSVQNQDVENESIEIIPGKLSLFKNEIYHLNYITSSNKLVEWTSSNPQVATVSNTGLVHALNQGQVIVTATLSGTDIKSQTVITVSAVDMLNVSAHSSEVGWLPAVSSMNIAGTTGMHLQLEALNISIADPNVDLVSQVHVTDIGDMEPVNENQVVGTTGQALGIEAARFYLTGAHAKDYELYYRAHVENYGWTSWAKADQWVGTKGRNLQLEAIEFDITPKGGLAPLTQGNVSWNFM